MSGTFILGIGAQKAGTTWLNKYLSASGQFCAGNAKEYHFWDVVFIPECRSMKNLGPFPKEINGLLRKSKLDQRDFDVYFDYFSRLLMENGCQISADITPSYSGLPVSAFEYISKGFEKRSVRCQIVFHVRDPVERCLSAVNFHKRMGNPHEGTPLDGDVEDALIKYASSQHAQIRTRYERTIPIIQSVFSTENIYIGVFEKMFQEREFASLSSFLGVTPRPEFRTKRINSSTKGSISVGDQTRRIVAEIFRETYEFCWNNIPETRNSWSYSLLDF